MINITRIKPIQNKFLSFFMEADDDEEEKPTRKMKVISVKPDNRSKKFDNVINKAKENEDTESDNEDDMELVDDMDEDEMPDTDDPMDDDSSDESNNDNENTDSETSDTSDNTETGQMNQKIHQMRNKIIHPMTMKDPIRTIPWMIQMKLTNYRIP